MKKLGLIINPIAGMGGKVGLKGTDGVLEEAIRRGALPQAVFKTQRALQSLLPWGQDLSILCCGGDMGEQAVLGLGFSCQVPYRPKGPISVAEDTQAGAQALAAAGADIIAFAGGDGTARDICGAVGESLPVMGIPAGVKIHSPVYAQSPEKAGDLLALYLRGQTTLTKEAEVVDIDEQDYRRGIINTRLYGYLTVPVERRLMQSGKAPSPQSEKAAQFAIAQSIGEEMAEDVYYLVGPGSTTRSLMEYLGAKNTLLGVDLVLNRQTVAMDLSEQEILFYLDAKPAKLIITPTGGQGYLLGRGNQQISPAIIRRLGKSNIIVAATKNKLASLGGHPLLIDTGEPETDRLLQGYIRVIADYRETVIYRLE